MQLYVRAPGAAVPMPLKELRGFERIALGPGERKRVEFRLKPAEAVARYDEAAKTFVVDPGEYEIQVGASSRDIRQTARFRVR